jgi:hypothetical protein
MSKARKPWRNRLYLWVMIGCIQFVLLTFIAMLVYPGGTHGDPTTTSYSFFKNFFSDLGITKTFTGEPNLASSVLFFIALTLAGLGLAAFFIDFPRFLSNIKVGKWLSIIGSFPGVISGLSFVGVAFAPGNLYGNLHKLFVQVAFLSFFVAVLFYIPALFLYRTYPKAYAWIFVAFAIVLGVYIWLLFYGPSISTPNGLIIQATGQKIVVYAAILSMLAQGYGAWKATKHLDG